MKTTINKIAVLLMLLIIITSNVFSQMREPVQDSLKYDTHTLILFNSTQSPFPQNIPFLVGYHWTNNESISRAIQATQNNVFAENLNDKITGLPLEDLVQKNALLMVQGVDGSSRYRLFSHALNDVADLNTHSMCWEPNMLVDDDDLQRDIIAKRPNDPHNPIFGFMNVNAVVQDTGANYSFLLVPDASYIGNTIFSDPWGSEYLRKAPPERINDTNRIYARDFWGYNYMVTIKIKRTGNNYLGVLPGANVLEIQLPFILNNDSTGFIRFEEKPSKDTFTIRSTLNQNRGCRTGLQGAYSNTTSIYITEDMIKDTSKIVTISARFRCWGKLDYEDVATKGFRNPKFSDPWGGTKQEIKKIGISAIYRGGCPIGIDDISILTPHSQALFEGAFDSLMCLYLQEDIDSVNRYNQRTQKQAKIYRFTDVSEGGVQNFGACRYIRKLFGDVFDGSNGSVFPILFEHYVQPPDRIIQLFKIGACVNAPYIDPSNYDRDTEYKKMGFSTGRTQRLSLDPVRLTMTEQLNSTYETYYPRNDTTYNYYNYNSFKNHENDIPRIYELKWKDGYGNSFQAFHQFNIWYNFYNDSISGFQYSDKPWYGQVHNLLEWRPRSFKVPNSKIIVSTLDTTKKTLFEYGTIPGDTVIFTSTVFKSMVRPPTAEEGRLTAYFMLLNACKGLIYDGLSYLGTEAYSRYAHDKALKAHPMETNEDNYDYLMNNEFGSDFLELTKESDSNHNLYFQPFNTIFLNFLTSATAQRNVIESGLGCKLERIYMGRRSYRTELYKIHRLIFDNNEAFMSHKLLCYYGKGYLKLYNQHPSLNPNECFLNKYVDTANIITRKVFQPQLNPLDSIYTTVPYSTVEPEEEQFYDLSLLRNGTSNLNLHHTIVIQNRRTDPLRLRYTGVPSKPRDLFFYTAAEIDDFCDIGGIDPLTDSNQTSDDWRKIYRQSLGYREISLPIRRLRELADSWGYLVKDLTYKYPARNSNEFTNMKYWMKDAYDHRIFQFIPCTYSKSLLYDTVNVKLKPAEAKFLDITRYYKVNDIKADVSRKCPQFPPPPPIPIPLDTCDILEHGMGLYFKKYDTTDANNCEYEMYFINKSDSCNFYVPLMVNFDDGSELDTIIDVPNKFQTIFIKNNKYFNAVFLPDTFLMDTTYLGRYVASCNVSHVNYKFGARDCYSSGVYELDCGICSCCDSLSVGVQPVNIQNFCRVYPTPYQRINLNSDEDCDYYGILVTGGFSPMDSTIITALSIMPDTANLQPIDISAYNRYINDPFMNIYCPTVCSYCLHFNFLGSSGEILCTKDFCITIDNTQYPIDIDPYGILSSQCYSIQPAKRAVPSEETHSGQMIIIDPNPTKGKTNVRLNLDNDLSGRLVLYTATGELIKEIFNGTIKKGSSDYQIDLSSQPSGMYIITIESDGMQYIKKFVKE